MRRRDFLKTTAASATATALAIAGGAGVRVAAPAHPDTQSTVEPAAGRLTGWRAEVDRRVRAHEGFLDHLGPWAYCPMVLMTVGRISEAVQAQLVGHVNRDGFGVVEAGCLRIVHVFPLAPWSWASAMLVIVHYRSDPWNHNLAPDGRFYDFTDNTGTHRLYSEADFSLISDALPTFGA